MLYRERRSWTEEEDQLLRDAVELEEPGSMNPSKWHAIAKHVPSRTNKDCRKRWFAKMASDVVKGGWAPEEDEKLVQAIEKYGTRWSLVSAYVQTRNSDQCAKRWTDTLNPMIDRTRWSAEADALLLKAVQEHGKLWTKIVRMYFPGRTGLAAKNRYNSITRFNTRAPRRKTYKPRAESESASSTASSSPSLSSSSSTSDASESPRTPPSFELNPLLSTEPALSDGIPSDFILDSPAWSSSPGCTSESLSPTELSYEELCSAMLSSSGLVNGIQISGIPTMVLQDRRLDIPWEGSPDEAFAQLRPVDASSDSSLSPSSSSPHSLESLENFLSYQTGLSNSNTAYSPASDTSLYQVGEEAAKILDDHCRNEYTFATNAPFWEPAHSDLHSFLAQWSNTY